MNAATLAVRQWGADVLAAWNRFWFEPTAPYTLALIRILAGLMLFYTHLVWGFDLEAFLGATPWVNREASQMMFRSPYAWSYLWHVESPGLLWTVHVLALLVFAALVVGFQTRVMAILAWLITLAYCHRLQGALYGLDQVNAMLAMYLAVGPAGGAWSVDRWIARRRGLAPGAPVASVGANLAIRLMQVHLSIVYLFGGISKLKGTAWWDGSAVWLAVGNYEYQSIDLTWLGNYTPLIALFTHVTVFWETFYPVLVWPRLTRPVMLILAVCVHGSIAAALGMPTFGLAMIIANLAFLEPEFVRKIVAHARLGNENGVRAKVV